MNYSKIGERLKLIRERKGLSYEQIFEITKIQPSILKGIEEGKSLVSPVFLRGFIKTYANSLGLDPEILFQLSEVGAKKEEKSTALEVPPKKEQTKKRRPLLYALPLGGIFLVLLMVWLKDRVFSLREKGTEEKKLVEYKSKENQEKILTESQALSSSLLKSSNQGQEKALEKPGSPEKETNFGKFDKHNKESALGKLEDQTLLASDHSLFQEIKASLFTKEILIQSSSAMDIYFKLDQKSTITKRLSPSEWFQIKAKESIYLRFDKMPGDISIFYNGKKVELENSKDFFERNFL